MFKCLDIILYIFYLLRVELQVLYCKSCKITSQLIWRSLIKNMKARKQYDERKEKILLFFDVRVHNILVIYKLSPPFFRTGKK